MTAVIPETLDLEADPDTMPGEAAHAGMLAAFAAENHAVWQKYRWLLSACRARAGTTRRTTGDRYAPHAAAAAFAWSGAMAAARYEFAHQILERLPMIGQAMRAGRLQESKAALLVSIVRDLDDAQAREVMSRILDGAPDLPHGALGTLAEKTAAEVDRHWSEARRRAAEARARVVARIAPSGAAELSGLDLPLDPAREAYDHVVVLADAVHAGVRARGRELRVGEVQSHVYLRLLHPDLLGVDDTGVVEILTDELAPRSSGDGSDGDGPDGGPGPDDDGPDDDGPDRGPRPRPRAESGGCWRSADSREREGKGRAEGPAAAAEPDPCGNGALAYRPGIVVRLGLSTLLGRDHRPAEVPGWGAVATSTARTLARTRPDATVHLVLHGADGRFQDVLALPSPRRRRGPGTRHRRQVIELTSTPEALDALDPADHLEPEATLIHDAQKALAALRARPPEECPALTRLDALRRHPRRELDRHVRARDRHCRFPGCRRLALTADLDHTLDWQYGGLTCSENLGALCRYHHRLKSDPDSGWRLTQPTCGHFVWISPQGARHTVDPPREPDPAGPIGVGGRRNQRAQHRLRARAQPGRALDAPPQPPRPPHPRRPRGRRPPRPRTRPARSSTPQPLRRRPRLLRTEGADGVSADRARGRG